MIHQILLNYEHNFVTPRIQAYTELEHYMENGTEKPWYKYSKLCMTDLHSLARSLSQYWQSAALPDMVPSRCGLISITLLTSLDAAEKGKETFTEPT